MGRLIPAAIVTGALAAMPLAAQQKPAAPSAQAKADAAKPVLLSGCLTGGPSSYTLSNVAVTRVAHEAADRPVGTAGASTSYSLVARDGVDLGDYVGKKVEVTGTLTPAEQPQKGALAPEPKVKQDDNPDVKAQTRAAVAAVTYPKVAATAVKLLSATCQ
jgi:hypothetical protein